MLGDAPPNDLLEPAPPALPPVRLLSAPAIPLVKKEALPNNAAPNLPRAPPSSCLITESNIPPPEELEPDNVPPLVPCAAAAEYVPAVVIPLPCFLNISWALAPRLATPAASSACR